MCSTEKDDDEDESNIENDENDDKYCSCGHIGVGYRTTSAIATLSEILRVLRSRAIVFLLEKKIVSLIIDVSMIKYLI